MKKTTRIKARIICHIFNDIFFILIFYRKCSKTLPKAVVALGIEVKECVKFLQRIR
jgi:hypothetical protein